MDKLQIVKIGGNVIEQQTLGRFRLMSTMMTIRTTKTGSIG
jgi:hypothetical protein